MNTITLFFIFIPILVVILLIANLLLAVHRPDSEKVTSYECGYSTIYGQTRNPFQISFFLVGLLFLVFDIEILVVYPLASCMFTVQSYGFWMFIIFFVVLTVGFVYEFGSGALYFSDKRSSLSNKNINTPLCNKNSHKTNRRLYSTSTKSSCYMKDAYEKDGGQNTSNVHIIARRHILSGAPTDINIINKVLTIAITQIELNLLISIKPYECLLSNNTKNVRKDIQSILGMGKSKIEYAIRIAGVYVFTNLRTGDQLVGSSINLAVRVVSYVNPTSMTTGIRLIFKDFRKFSLSDYKLQVYIIQKGYNSHEIDILQKKTLALEQYFIFTLNSTLNDLKVAGSAPFVSIMDPDIMDRMKKITDIKKIPIFVYVKNVLVYKTSSQKQLRELTGISRGSVSKGLLGSLIYGVISISSSFDSNLPVNLLGPTEFKDMVSNLRVEHRKVIFSDIATKHAKYTNNKKVSVIATNLYTREVYTATSITEMSKLLRTLGSDKYVSPSTISVSIRNNKQCKRWQFKQLAFIFSS